MSIICTCPHVGGVVLNPSPACNIHGVTALNFFHLNNRNGIEQERDALRAQLAAAQEENVNLLAANRDLKLYWDALKSDHDAAQEDIERLKLELAFSGRCLAHQSEISEKRRAELAKVTELLREMFEAFCNSVVENDDQTDRRRAVWSDIHTYLNPLATQK